MYVFGKSSTYLSYVTEYKLTFVDKVIVYKVKGIEYRIETLSKLEFRGVNISIFFYVN